MSRFHGTWAVKPESDDPASPRCSAVLDQEVLPKGEAGSLPSLGLRLQHQSAACKRCGTTPFTAPSAGLQRRLRRSKGRLG